MTEPTKLTPCPFCGAAAHFEMDEGRWEWVECESCGMQGNRSASLMEDCKPKLAEEWNRRTLAPVGVEPIGYLYCGGSYGDEPEDWEIVADQPQCDKLNEHHWALGKEARLPIYTTPQPVVREPLTEAQINAAAKKLAECLNYQWDYMSYPSQEEMRKHAQAVIGAAHSIKGGQHGAE